MLGSHNVLLLAAVFALVSGIVEGVSVSLGRYSWGTVGGVTPAAAVGAICSKSGTVSYYHAGSSLGDTTTKTSYSKTDAWGLCLGKDGAVKVSLTASDMQNTRWNVYIVPQSSSFVSPEQTMPNTVTSSIIDGYDVKAFSSTGKTLEMIARCTDVDSTGNHKYEMSLDGGLTKAFTATREGLFWIIIASDQGSIVNGYHAMLSYSMTVTRTAKDSASDSDPTAGYIVCFRPGDYSSGTVYSDTFKKGSSLTLRGVTYIRNCHTQKGWSTSAAGTTKDYSFGDKYAANSNLTLYPYWEWDGTYEIVYACGEYGTGSGKTYIKQKGEIVTLQGVLFTRSGYKQTGWTSGSGLLGQTYELGGLYWFDQSITFYPVWTSDGSGGGDDPVVKKTYTLTLAPGQLGTGKTQTMTKTQGVPLSLPGALFTRVGYEQTGWVSPEQTTSSIFTTPLMSYSLRESYTWDGNLTLYPLWSPIYYAISYQNDKGAANANPTSYTVESSVVFKPLPDVDGYSFSHWEPASIGVGSQEDVTVVAHWTGKKVPDPEPETDPVFDLDADLREANQFAIVFDSSSGTGTMPRQTITRESVVTMSPCTFTPPSGKRFAGWRCSNGKRYDDGMLVFNLAKPGETVTMTAIWE